MWQRFLIYDLKALMSSLPVNMVFDLYGGHFFVNSDLGLFHQVMFSLSQGKDILLVENSFLENDFKVVSP